MEIVQAFLHTKFKYLSHQNIREDIVVVHTFITKKFKWDKVGIHGISLGGIAACHLAGQNLVSTCFADRTFSSIEDIIIHYPLGNILVVFYKILLFENSNNVKNFILVNYYLIQTRAAKILSCDPSDSIVIDSASLKTGVANSLIRDLFDSTFRIKPKKAHKKYHANEVFLSLTFSSYELKNCMPSVVEIIKDSYNTSVLKTNKLQVYIHCINCKENFQYDKLNEDTSSTYKLKKTLSRL